MTPTVDGKVLHFEARGLYDGVSLLRDNETGSFWHHITGAAMYGPLKGARLRISNLLQMTPKEALDAYPGIRIAISDRPMRQRRWGASLADRLGGMLSDGFRRTMHGEDTRRPSMDVGLGIWTEDPLLSRYYPLETVQESHDVVLDELGGRRVAVYFSPASHGLMAMYTDAERAEWREDALYLSNGDVLRNGVLYGPEGERKTIERPLQQFTRWYGYALTFPKTEIYEPEK